MLDDAETCRRIEFELIKLGIRLRWLGDGTGRFTWHDLGVVVVECFQWSNGDYLLAAAVDSLHILNWQTGGGKGQKPKMIPRPGEDANEPAEGHDPFKADESGTFRGEMTLIPELNEWLGWTVEKSRDELIFEAYLAGGVTYAQLAERFGMSASTVGRIVRAQKQA